MAAIDTGDALTPDEATRLTEFARACKAAARIVALYPATHPTIQAALQRVTDAATSLRAGSVGILTVLPDKVLLGGKTTSRPDGSIGELASLLHGHTIGELRLADDLNATQWHTFLMLLARPIEDVRAEGGIARVWLTAGVSHLEVRQIDYAEVLRERTGSLDGGWNSIIANYLDGELDDLDDETLKAVFEIAEDPTRFKRFTEELVTRASDGKLRGNKDVVLRVLQALVDFAAGAHPEQLDRVLSHIADAVPRLTPDLVVTLITTGVPKAPGSPQGIDLAGEVRARLTDHTVGEFVAQSVSRDQGATARLAEAFQALVPDDKRAQLLDLARQEAEKLPIGQQADFPDLWKSAADLLTSYSDSKFVSDEYGRELAAARAHAIEVERVSDDPPERVNSWLSTVSETEVRRLDQQVLLDLLTIETRAEAWRALLDSALTTIDRLVAAGSIPLAHQLLDRVASAASNGGAFGEPARAGLDRLRKGPLMTNVVGFVRKASDGEMAPVSAFCRTLGPDAIRPLAEALASEHGSAVKRLREILLSFGAAGGAYVDELRSSANPAVRRTAVELLRAFGGADALADLTRLLDDPEPAVQREAIRGIVQIGSEPAYATLTEALKSSDARRRDTIMQALTAYRDEHSAPLFVYVLEHSDPSGGLESVYISAIEALGKIADDPDSVAALKKVLYRGETLAPLRTNRLRAAAATALRASGSTDAQQVLEQAAQEGPRGVRRAARAALSAPAPRVPPRRTS